MKLKKESLDWALLHLIKENDTDLFPAPIEISIINQKKEKIVSLLKEIDVGNYCWKSFRRFMIPKGELSYRMITQLHPLDSLILSAIIYEYGSKIEAKRIADSKKVVFSYRFSPREDGTFYSKIDGWKKFWEENIAKTKANTCGCVACLDISDFYNQIYHHTLENMMIDVGFPNEINKSIMNLLENITQKVSRGIPVGPHATHILAEMSLIQLDESLELRNINYCRYSDDIIVFAKDENDARAKVYLIAQLLDSNQKLTLQRQKTQIYTKESFIIHAEKMLADNPLDIEESEMLKIINKYSNNNPYIKIPHGSISQQEIQVFSKDKVESLIEKYMDSSFPDYPRLRWLFRRLTQIGTPSAVDFCIRNMDRLIPAISDVCQYLIVATNTYDGDWELIGNKTIKLLESDLFKSNEFFQITLLNLFVKNTKIDHISHLILMYTAASENIRRKIILSAYINNATAFIRDLKEQYSSMHEWTKRAYIIACSTLIKEERKFLLKKIRTSFDKTEILEGLLTDWAMEQ